MHIFASTQQEHTRKDELQQSKLIDIECTGKILCLVMETKLLNE
jgi:hypothetical protein